MAGSRLRLIFHDGNRVQDSRQISTKHSFGAKIIDVTKANYNTESKAFQGLGEEITAINGVKKEGEDGFQVYLAIMKAGKVVEMGLPHVKESGKEKFLNAANMKISDLEECFDHLPGDVEIAIIWRFDRGMTQDLVLGENSMTGRFMPEDPGFSLLDRKPALGCGSGFDKNGEAVYELTQVLIYTGERDEPIRMANVTMVVPEIPQVSDNFCTPPAYPQQPARTEQTDLTLRMCWCDELKTNDATIAPVEFICEIPQKDEIPSAVVVLVCSEPEEADEEFEPDPIPILNPSEKKVWNEIHSIPEKPMAAPKIKEMRVPVAKNVIRDLPPKKLEIARLPKPQPIQKPPAAQGLPETRKPSPSTLKQASNRPAPAGKEMQKRDPAPKAARTESKPLKVQKKKAARTARRRKARKPKQKREKPLMTRKRAAARPRAKPRARLPDKKPKRKSKTASKPKPSAALQSNKPKTRPAKEKATKPGQKPAKAAKTLKKKKHPVKPIGKARAGNSKRRRPGSRSSAL